MEKPANNYGFSNDWERKFEDYFPRHFKWNLNIEELINTQNPSKHTLFDRNTNKNFVFSKESAHQSTEEESIINDIDNQEIESGCTRESIITELKSCHKYKVPSMNTRLTIRPTHVISVERFFAFIIDDRNSNEMYFRELIFKMNAAEYISKYQSFDRPPILKELVIAKFTDGSWYRARIVNESEDQIYKVMYLDYGFCSYVEVNDLRKWCDLFDYLPFQAQLFRIENVVANRRLSATIMFQKLILNRKMDAIVV